MEEKNIQLNICYSCMSIMPEGSSVCPVCGNDNRVRSNPENTLPEGTVLFRKYLVGKMIGRGGFGVTYIGYDLDLQLKVAIKEYFPAGVSYRSSRSYDVISDASSAAQDHTAFSKGREAFLDEARMLASVNSPYIVHVRDFFREHGTAYIVMDYVNGLTLPKAISRNGGRISAERVVSLMLPLIDQLDELHERNIIHRDIKPDNIILVKDRKGIHPVLLDFGAARSFISSNVSKTYTAVVTPGFAPLEQYSQRSRQGAFTDVYGICATMYYAITGAIPPAATERSIDNVPVPSFRERGVTAPEYVETAIMHGLALKSENRTQTMQALYAELSGGATVPNSGQSRQATASPAPAQHTANPPLSHVRQKAGNTGRAEGRRTQKSGGRKIAVILLVLLIVAFAGTSAVYLFGSHRLEEKIDSGFNEAIPTSESDITPTQTAQPTAVPTEIPDASALKAADIAVGDHVIVGSYEQDNDLTNGPEPIEWIVLDKDNDNLFLVSRFSLDRKQYNQYNIGTSWTDSTLYTWLNGSDSESFINLAFSKSIQQKLCDKSYLGKVFLLSSNECSRYFKRVDERKCEPTAYAIRRGASEEKYTPDTTWWTRTYKGSKSYIVDGSGMVTTSYVNNQFAIRPAVWINVAAIAEKLTSVEANAQNPSGTSMPASTITTASEYNKEKSFENTHSSHGVVNVGDYVSFGIYEQDNNLNNGKEPIEWQVLDVKDDSALLISKYALDRQLYNDYYANVTWETCTLRSWLNGTFLNEAFTVEEQKKILKSWITADKYSENTADPGNDTIDQIFLLSVTEVEEYLKDKRCQGTEYARARGCYNSTNKWNPGNCVWWTRTPGVSSGNAAYIYDGGGINSEGISVTFTNLAARPAMWVDISALQR